jgi:hypothetical protein
VRTARGTLAGGANTATRSDLEIVSAKASGTLALRKCLLPILVATAIIVDGELILLHNRCPLVVAGTALLVDIFFTAVHQLNTTTATMDQYIFLNIMIPCLVASSGFWSFMFRLMPLH